MNVKNDNISKLQFDEFLRAIGISKNDTFSLLLGAGCSINSDIPSAEDCIWEWKRDIYKTNNPSVLGWIDNYKNKKSQTIIQNWLDNQGIYPEKNTKEEYSFYAYKCYPIDEHRRQYFEKICSGKTPSIGYKTIPILAKSGMLDSVWTTNLDDLIITACAGKGIQAIEISLDTVQRINQRTQNRKELPVIKLHGDFKYGELKNTEKEIADISNNINVYQYSKEGIAINNMVDQWLNALIQNTKAKAEIKVLDKRRKDYQTIYSTFSPVGTEIKSREREINVTEQTYLEMVHALNLAYLRKRNIQLTTAGLDTITEPAFPLFPNGGKRLLFIIAAFLGSIIFILGYNLLIELLDRTLRDADRTQRLTGIKVLGAFSGRGQLRFRGYSKAWHRISAAYACNKLNCFLKAHETTYINLLSIEKGEGKSFVGKYMIEEWENLGLKVKYLKAGEDFPTDDATFLLASNFSDIYSTETTQKSDIVLIEYPAIQYNCLPPILLNKAAINLLIANAQRVWKKSDEELLFHLKDIIKEAPIVIYLNNANRYAVEDFTGELPPYSSQHSLATQMMHMGLTAKKAPVK